MVEKQEEKVELPPFMHQIYQGEPGETAWWGRAILDWKKTYRTVRGVRKEGMRKLVCTLPSTNQGMRGERTDRMAFAKRINAAKRLDKALKKAAELFHIGQYGIFHPLYKDKFLRIVGFQQGSYVYLYAAPVLEDD